MEMYSSGQTVVARVSWLPEGSVDFINVFPYNARAWCAPEKAMSTFGLKLSSGCSYEVPQPREVLHCGGAELASLAPVHPDQFEERVATGELHLTNKGDIAVVPLLYRAALDRVAPLVRELKLPRLPLSELAALLRALPLFIALQSLNLFASPELGGAGPLARFTAALLRMPLPAPQLPT
eukprot:gene4495-10256_t